jgi:hypothetical protein
MSRTQVSVAPITCTLSDLIAFATNPQEAETIFQQDSSLSFCITVEFGRSGAIALMPLELPLTVEFFARPFGKGEELELGTTSVKTIANQLRYTPTLIMSQGLAVVGCVPEKVYKISALVRVGVANAPAFVNGFIEGLTIQLYRS